MGDGATASAIGIDSCRSIGMIPFVIRRSRTEIDSSNSRINMRDVVDRIVSLLVNASPGEFSGGSTRSVFVTTSGIVARAVVATDRIVSLLVNASPGEFSGGSTRSVFVIASGIVALAVVATDRIVSVTTISIGTVTSDINSVTVGGFELYVINSTEWNSTTTPPPLPPE